MKPRIGVTSTPAVHGARRVDEVNRAFTTAVERAGAIPLVLPVLDGADAQETLSGLDGLLLSGGGDLSAWSYGQDQSEPAHDVDPARDAWELALVAAAHVAALPILGICRGAQLLNVSAGGTLVQDLPAVTTTDHRICERDAETVHTVRVEPASTLTEITLDPTFGVNSLHHQAVGRVGAGLRPVAWSPDGVIEAVEGVDGLPVLGVQWHPELLAEAVHLRLFRWLVEAARRHHEAATPVPLDLAPVGRPAEEAAPASASAVALVDDVA